MEQSFYKLSGEHSSLIYMDKIRKDETLEDTLERILQELGIAETFIRARVFGDIEFDRDKDGILTPRLLVQVFVDKIEKNEEIIAKSKRSWNSNS
jgi:alpha-N-acetylglucosamine transferase